MTLASITGRGILVDFMKAYNISIYGIINDTEYKQNNADLFANEYNQLYSNAPNDPDSMC